jgi:hypothetical protein
MAETTITGLPNATTPLDGTERVPMDQNGTTVDASTQAIANLAGGAISSAVAAHVAAADPHPGYLTAAEGEAAYVGLSDARLSDAREWTAATIEQAEAETGTATTRRAFTAQRVRQAIAAWWTSASTAAGRAMVEALNEAAQRTLLGLGTADSPSFTGLTITGAAPVVIPHIHGSIAGNFYVHVKNTSGGPLAAGTAVYATGSVGDTDRITVAACDPTDPLKMPAIGVLETALAQNGDGDAVILGELRPFNSNSYQIRDRLYVGAGGALVATPPASGLVQAVGSVVRVNVNTGTILVSTGAAMARVGFTGAYGDLSGRPTLGTAAAANTGDFAPAAQGVTNGNSHDHNGGDGGQIAYGSLSGLPSIPAPTNAAPQPLAATAAIGSGTDYALGNHRHQRDSDVIVIPVGDESSDLTTGTSQVRFRMPFAATLLAVRANVNTAPTGSTLIVDVNEAGASVLGTKLSIDATEFSSTTAASAATITDSSLADDAEISIDIDQIGSTVAGAGLKVSLFVRRV